jgi:hypothetical protein
MVQAGVGLVAVKRFFIRFIVPRVRGAIGAGAFADGSGFEGIYSGFYIGGIYLS